MSASFTITKVVSHSADELLQKLRGVSMLKDPEAFPYRDARIELRTVSYAEVVPAQRYVLADGLYKARNLRWELEKHGVNLFELNGYVSIWTDQSDEPIDVLPPVVEQSVEANGLRVNIINDGMHRMYVGRLEWRLPQVVYIENIPPQYPYYAFPIPDGDWNVVTVVEEGEEIPAGLIKKWHRTSDNKKLYRNFNSQFINVGGPRGQGKAG